MMPLSITTSLSRSPCLNNRASSPNSGSNSAPVRRFHTKPESGRRPRRFIAVEWHPGELYRRVDFIVTFNQSPFAGRTAVGIRHAITSAATRRWL
jgi:hypothetical protein